MSTQPSSSSMDVERTNLRYRIPPIDYVPGDAASLRREVMVSLCPMLSLPVEVLHRILEYVPDQKNEDVWFSSRVDTSMLLPISLTCRRLRGIAISHTALWQSVQIGVDSTIRGLCRDAIIHSRSRPLDADLLLSSYSETDVAWADTRALWPRVSARIREVHLVLQIKELVPEHPWDSVFDVSHPRLESFSLHDASRHRFPPIFPPFATGLTSQLRRLTLWSVTGLPLCSFSNLTHLALIHVGVDHPSVIGLLSRSPNLECFIFRATSRRVHPHNERCRYPDLTLSCLRRVVLWDLSSSFLSFYLQKIPKHPRCYSLQVLGLTPNFKTFDAGAVLLHHSIAPVTTIHISMESLRLLTLEPTEWYILSVGYLGSQTLVRVGTEVQLESEPEPESESEHGPEQDPEPQPTTQDPGPADWLRHTLQDKSALQFVNEVWIVNLSRHGSCWDGFEEPLRASIAALPSLEVVSFAMDASQHCGELDLLGLPDGRDPDFASPRLKTVRLVYGYRRDLEYRNIINAGRYGDLLKPRETKQLSLSKLLGQLQTGAFEYLDRLVLRVASHFTFDEAELAQLRGYAVQVDVEYSDERPDMPLPEFAREPEASGCPTHWQGALY